MKELTPKKYLLRAIIFGCIAFLGMILDANNLNNLISILFGSSYYLSFIYFCEYITRKYGNFSILNYILCNKTGTLKTLLAGTFFGIGLDGLLNWINKLWFYPKWSNLFYALIFIPGFTAYMLCLVCGYEAVKIIIDKFFKFREINKNAIFAIKQNKILQILGIICVIIIIISLCFMLTQVLKVNSFEININHASVFQANLFLLVVLAFCFLFLFEYINIMRGRSGFITNIFEHKTDSFIALILSSIILSITMEIQNRFILNLWTYNNWPMQNTTIFGIPVLVFLTWPLHIAVALSLYRLFYDSPTKHFFEGDTIN